MNLEIKSTRVSGYVSDLAPMSVLSLPQSPHINLAVVLDAVERELAVLFFEIKFTFDALLDVHEHLLSHLNFKQLGAHCL